ncbi:MAG: PCRF domain-containing protein [Tissierellia bacterium]|nr:PCRF domain-containing protein [Tissierellia bacterium]
MELKENIIVPLGYGKFIRSDRIVALEPIENDRGPGKRTYVYAEGIDSPLIASRTEISILANIVETPREILETIAAIELMQDLLDDIEQTGPMLKKSIKKEAGIDLDKIKAKIEEILNHELEIDGKSTHLNRS